GVSADAGTDSVRWSGFAVTETGLIPKYYENWITRGRFAEHECYYLSLSGIVIRDPRLFRPELAGQYEPAKWIVPRVSVFARVYPNEIADERLSNDAWPCGLIRLQPISFARAVSTWRSRFP